MKSKIVYAPVFQKFVEYDELGNIVKQGSFKISERTEMIIESGPATVIFLSDGSKGLAMCHPEDQLVQSKTTGRKLAYLRAKLVSIQKEIKQVLNSTHKD